MIVRFQHLISLRIFDGTAEDPGSVAALIAPKEETFQDTRSWE